MTLDYNDDNIVELYDHQDESIHDLLLDLWIILFNNKNIV